jgi:hypothetical protein
MFSVVITVARGNGVGVIVGVGRGVEVAVGPAVGMGVRDGATTCSTCCPAW